MALPEPWLRGVDPDVDPVIAHLLRGSLHIREDLRTALSPLTPEQLWSARAGIGSAGFQARHIAGSTRRLATYLEGGQLSAEQLAAIAAEGVGSDPAEVLLLEANGALDHYDNLLRGLRPSDFGQLREIGRKKLQTTVISLAIHIVEHGMRHVGLAIAAARAAQSA